MSLVDHSQQWYPSIVQVTVLQARGLRIKGKNGTNDAYAVMLVAKEKFSTSVVEKTVSPMWKEEATFELPLFHHESEERCTLQVHVMHRSLMGPDKLLGRAVVNLLELNEVKSRNKTEWFKLLDKSGKLDKDRGEVLLDIKFMRNNMTASMLDLSATNKSRSRLDKLKDKVRGKKKEGLSDSASAVVPSFSQVLTDSEEEAAGGREGGAAKDGKKKHKLKSLFSPKSNLQRNMSQSMSVLGPLPERNTPLSGSRSSGLNVGSSEGKKKFRFLTQKKPGSSDNKGQTSSLSPPGLPKPDLAPAAEQTNLCINGSHMYKQEPQPRSARAGSTFSVASSGLGSMEDLHRPQGRTSSNASIDSLRALWQPSAWAEEGNSRTTDVEEEVEEQGILEESRKAEDDSRICEEQERMRKVEEEDIIQQKKKESSGIEGMEIICVEEKRKKKEEEKKRVEEEIIIQFQEQEQVRIGTEKIAEEERKRRLLEEQKRAWQDYDKMEGLGKVGRIEEQEMWYETDRLRREKEVEVEEEEKERSRKPVKRVGREEEEEKRSELEKQRRIREKEEERITREVAEERRKIEEERMRREETEERRKTEEERMRKEEAEERRKIEEERMRREEAEERRKTEKERMRKEEEEERRKKEEERMRREEEEERRKTEKERMRKKEEKERMRREEAEVRRKIEEERMREEAEKRRKTEEERMRREEAEVRRKIEEERMREEAEEKRKSEEERMRREEAEERSKTEEERMRKEEAEERRKIEEERMRMEEAEERRKIEEERVRREEDEERRKKEEERMRREEAEERRKTEEERMRKEEEEERLRMEEAEERRRKEKEEERMMREEEDERRNIEEEKSRQEEQYVKVRRKETERKERETEERVRREVEEKRIKTEEDERRKEEEGKRKEEAKIMREEEEHRIGWEDEVSKVTQVEERIVEQDNLSKEEKDQQMKVGPKEKNKAERAEERKVQQEEIVRKERDDKRKRQEEPRAGMLEEDSLLKKEVQQVEESRMACKKEDSNKSRIQIEPQFLNGQSSREDYKDIMLTDEMLLNQKEDVGDMVDGISLGQPPSTDQLEVTTSSNHFQEVPNIPAELLSQTAKMSAVKRRSSSSPDPLLPPCGKTTPVIFTESCMAATDTQEIPSGQFSKKRHAPLPPSNQRATTKEDLARDFHNLTQTKTSHQDPPWREDFPFPLMERTSAAPTTSSHPVALPGPQSQSQGDQNGQISKQQVNDSWPKTSSILSQNREQTTTSTTAVPTKDLPQSQSIYHGQQPRALTVAKHSKGLAPSRPHSSLNKRKILGLSATDGPPNELIVFDAKAATAAFQKDCGSENKGGAMTALLAGDTPESIPPYQGETSTSASNFDNAHCESQSSKSCPLQRGCEYDACQIQLRSLKKVSAPLPPAKSAVSCCDQIWTNQNTDSSLKGPISRKDVSTSKKVISEPCHAIPASSSSKPKLLETSGSRQQRPQKSEAIGSGHGLHPLLPASGGGGSLEPFTASGSAEEAGKNGEQCAATSPRPLLVKPLSTLEHQPICNVPGGQSNIPSLHDGVQESRKAKDSLATGPYTQLTNEELISLVVKQHAQLSLKDKTIAELERYIDNLLVRVIEESPHILMSLNSIKRGP